MLKLLSAFLLIYLIIVLSIRNEKEEGICQPCLTSKTTSPLIPTIKRNKTYDEECEFACELVLQDESLPNQIRVTIHEGLSLLGIRQAEQNINTKEFDFLINNPDIKIKSPAHRLAMKHLEILTEMLPKVFRFQFRAGFWSLNPYVNNFEAAATYLHAAIYGSASNDTSITKEDLYSARREYARALGYLGLYHNASIELSKLLIDYPSDRGVSYLLKELYRLMDFKSIYPTAYSIINQQNEEKQQISKHAVDNFTDLALGKVDRLSYLPSSSEFSSYISNRIPLIVSLQEKHFWDYEKLSNDSYLNNLFGDVEVQVEIQTQEEDNDTVFGYGVDVKRHIMQYKDFYNKLVSNYSKPSHSKRNFIEYEINSNSNSHNTTFEELDNVRKQEFYFDDKEDTKVKSDIFYLNTQSTFFINEEETIDRRDNKVSDNTTLEAKYEVYRPPLTRIIDKIPLPRMLEKVIDDITEINLWMGNSYQSIKNETTSRLHFDATDNLYILLQGTKTFELIPPQYGKYLPTLAPIYYVDDSGLSFTYNPLKFNLKNDDSSIYYESDIINSHFVELVDLKEIFIDSSNQSLDSVKIVITLNAGDILYLPTGWFHRVTSSGGMHRAINIWWKPPGWQDMVKKERNAARKLFRKLQSDKKSAENDEL